MTLEEAKQAVSVWLSTPHTPKDKYDRRIEEMDTMSLEGAVLAVSLPYTIVPSYPAPSFTALTSLIDVLEGTAQGIQIDMVDGEFAPSVSWPFTEPDPKEAMAQVSKYKDAFILEADCMCLEPLQYLDTLVASGPRRVVIHMESTDAYSLCIAHKDRHDYKLGFAITNDTPIQVLDAYIDGIDFVQVMGIKEIGKQGEPFDTRTLHTVARLRARYPLLEIAVDGGVNADTLHDLKKAGATRFAPGSAIVKADDQKSA